MIFESDALTNTLGQFCMSFQEAVSVNSSESYTVITLANVSAQLGDSIFVCVKSRKKP